MLQGRSTTLNGYKQFDLLSLTFFKMLLQCKKNYKTIKLHDGDGHSALRWDLSHRPATDWFPITITMTLRTVYDNIVVIFSIHYYTLFSALHVFLFCFPGFLWLRSLTAPVKHLISPSHTHTHTHSPYFPFNDSPWTWFSYLHVLKHSRKFEGCLLIIFITFTWPKTSDFCRMRKVHVIPCVNECTTVLLFWAVKYCSKDGIHNSSI